jgi:hypothetical protein
MKKGGSVGFYGNNLFTKGDKFGISLNISGSLLGLWLSGARGKRNGN